MLERVLDAGVPAAWVTADEVYGGSPALRGLLEGRGLWHVLAVKCTELLADQAPDGPAGTRTSAAQLAAAVPAPTTRTARSPSQAQPGGLNGSWVSG
jgi:hypothetical protein